VAGSVFGGVFLPISFTNQNATVITSSGKFSSGETRRQFGTVSATFMLDQKFRRISHWREGP